MTKKEIKSAINKAVYQFAESLGYIVSDDNDGSCVTFFKPESNIMDSIDYHRSYHETYVLNWSKDETKTDADLINKFVSEQISKYQ